MKKQKPLNVRQQKFIEYYLECGNATQALKKAGYKSSHPNKSANQILSMPEVKEQIDKYRQEINAESLLTINYKLQYIYDAMELYKKKGMPGKAAKMLEIANKMQGHNAAEKQIIDVNGDLAVVEQLTQSYINKNGMVI